MIFEALIDQGLASVRDCTCGPKFTLSHCEWVIVSQFALIGSSHVLRARENDPEYAAKLEAVRDKLIAKMGNEGTSAALLLPRLLEAIQERFGGAA